MYFLSVTHTPVYTVCMILFCICHVLCLYMISILCEPHLLFFWLYYLILCDAYTCISVYTVCVLFLFCDATQSKPPTKPTNHTQIFQPYLNLTTKSCIFQPYFNIMPFIDQPCLNNNNIINHPTIQSSNPHPTNPTNHS
jgi:hypothetical protein